MVVGAVCLGGCGAPQSAGETYLERLSSVIERPVSWTPELLPKYPVRRNLLQQIEPLNISVAQFARLHACDMGGLIGARNGSLARLAKDSQRLLYELAWLEAADGCIAAGQEWLQPVQQQKRKNLAHILWNATFASDEMARAMGASANHSPQAEQHLRGLADLINNALAQQPESLRANFEPTLQDLANTVRIGERRNDWAYLRAQLQAATIALSTREPAICLSAQPNNRSRRMLTVFTQFYVSGWQAEFTGLLNADRRWLSAVQRSYQLLQGSAPVEFVSWYDATLNADMMISEWQRTEQAVADHVQAWQGIFKQCGIDISMLRGTL